MFDVSIKHGLVVDGMRTKPYPANVYIQGGKIAAITAEEYPAKEELDAYGHIIAPGFIDIHTHSDVSYLSTDKMETKLLGGVTFEMVGNCGFSVIPTTPASVKDTLDAQGDTISAILNIKLTEENFTPRDVTSYAADVAAHGVTINLGVLIGHGALRAAVIGWENRQMTPSELEEMCSLLEEMLKQGAAGVSLGLIFPPGSFCDTNELLALARVIAKYDRVLTVHMRNENVRVFEALDEMIEVAERTGCRVQISHLKLMGKSQWGRANELLARIDLARARGVRITSDQYPYIVSNSPLTSCFPKWAMEGGFKKFVERLKDDDEWAKISEGGLPQMYQRGGPENIIVNEIKTGISYPEILFKSLPEIADQMGLPLLEAIRRILIRCEGDIKCLYKNMSEEDLLKIMSRMDVSVISDGTAFSRSNYGGHPHPRNIGSTARFLSLARDKNLMPVEDAVYKLTGLPATVAGFADQFGFLKPGLDATVTVFDWNTVEDRATFENPVIAPGGIDHVIVNGQIVLKDGEITDNRPGKVYLAGF